MEYCCCCLVTKLYPNIFNTTDSSPPGSSVHGILQARILEWVAIPFSRGSSQPRNQIYISCLASRFFITEPLGKIPTMEYYSTIKRMKSCHLQQQGCIWRLSFKGNLCDYLSHRERQTSYDMAYKWNLKKRDRNEFIYKRNRLIVLENELVVTKREG